MSNTALARPRFPSLTFDPMFIGPPYFYRYLEKLEYAERFFDTGELMLGSFARYQAMEAEQTDLVRGDKDEGFAMSTIDGFFENVDESSHPLVQDFFGDVRGNTFKNNMISGARMHMSAPASQILCLSDSLSFRLASHFRCSVCIGIACCESAREILSSACGEEFSYRGFRQVSYSSIRTRRHDHPDSRKAGDVVKARRVSTDGFQIEREREVRAIWRASGPSVEVKKQRWVLLPDLRPYARLHSFAG